MMEQFFLNRQGIRKTKKSPEELKEFEAVRGLRISGTEAVPIGQGPLQVALGDGLTGLCAGLGRVHVEIQSNLPALYPS
jgi:hypothetical protein